MDSPFQGCEDFFQQAEALVSTTLKPSISECRGFLAQAEQLLRLDQTTPLDECQVFLSQAENLVSPPLPPLTEFQTFLETAEKHFLKYWHRRINLLREADPRSRPDFQTVNLLEIFGISRQEAPHSRFLDWLLNPQESHGLGTAFLDSFLQLAQRMCKREFEIDLNDVEVKRERGTDRGVPDITVIGPNFLCVVENKILAAEGRDQTQRYADAAEEEARQRGISPVHLLLVFLSPTGRQPKDRRFHALAYPPLLRLLENLLNEHVSPLVEIAIRQFVFNLRARVLHEYDQAMAVVTHLVGYEERSDLYLKEHWQEVESLIRALRR